ncbi:MAG: hypothetical protein N4A71_20200 [Carboxylicivirga sp.]|jgi:hypothetical protein|nr:hypothetical protein [Carboxylicivirga sp.]
MKYKLKLPQPLTVDQLQAEINNGYRFVAFQYCFSPIFATYYPFSPAYLLKSREEASRYINKYNWISAIFGWWGIPYGPQTTIRCMRFNLKGGLDVTQDIMKNITDQDLQNNCVQLEETTMLYRKPDRSDLKTIGKLLRNYSGDSNLKECYAGWSLIEDYCFCVGIKADNDFEKYAEAFEQHLRKKFFKHVQIQLIDLNNEAEAIQLLRKQGVPVLAS